MDFREGMDFEDLTHGRGGMFEKKRGQNLKPEGDSHKMHKKHRRGC
jgi:hypothetical protein